MRNTRHLPPAPPGHRSIARSLRRAASGALLVAVALVAGGSLAASQGGTSAVLQSSRLDGALRDYLDDVIAADLGGALSGSLEPLTTTVQVPRVDETRVARTITLMLIEHGFGVQRVAVDQGPNLLVLTRVAERAPEGLRVTARAAIGPVAVRRDYLVGADRRVHTASALRVYGAPNAMPLASLSRDRLKVTHPSHLDVEYVASRPAGGE